MGIIRYAAAVGLGYALARPEGRQQLLKLRDQGLRLLRRPEVARLQEQGQELVTQQVSAATDAVKEKLGRSDDRSDTSTRAADVFPSDAPAPAPAVGTPAVEALAVSAPTSDAAAPTGADSTPSVPRHAADPAPSDPAQVSGFGGRTVEEDSQAAVRGIPPLPRTGPTPSARPTPSPGTSAE